MTLNDDMDRLHREWAALKAELMDVFFRVGIPGLFLTLLGVLAYALLATLVTLP